MILFVSGVMTLQKSQVHALLQKITLIHTTKTDCHERMDLFSQLSWAVTDLFALWVIEQDKVWGHLKLLKQFRSFCGFTELSRSSSGDEDGYLAHAAQEAENNREAPGKRHGLRSLLKEGRRRLERDKGSAKEESNIPSVCPHPRKTTSRVISLPQVQNAELECKPMHLKVLEVYGYFLQFHGLRLWLSLGDG